MFLQRAFVLKGLEIESWSFDRGKVYERRLPLSVTINVNVWMSFEPFKTFFPVHTIQEGLCNGMCTGI